MLIWLEENHMQYICNTLYFGEWSDGSLMQIQKAQVVQWGGGICVPIYVKLWGGWLEPNNNILLVNTCQSFG